MFYLCCVTAVVSLPFWPYIPGVPTNESQQIHAIQNVMPVYYLNQEKYFYLFILHMNATILIGGTALVATGMMIIGYLKHACGMFKIAR